MHWGVRAISMRSGYPRVMPLSFALILFELFVMVLAISLHDAAQAWAANRLGDPTARMLGRHIFAHMGERVRIFQHVQFSFGYNLSIGDDCWIHRHVLLDDRGGITLHERTSISDYANIYSHTHNIRQQADVTNKATEIGPRARITYHATVLAGSRVGEDAMLGAMGVATRDVPPHTVAVGIPAKVKREK